LVSGLSVAEAAIKLGTLGFIWFLPGFSSGLNTCALTYSLGARFNGL
jgi:hypothetical protein